MPVPDTPPSPTSELTLHWIHEGPGWIAVDKPSGLLSVPGRGEDKQDCASRRVQARHEDALIVHRLDMATSGLLVFARGLPMQRLLSEAFAHRQVSKRYSAVVSGLFPEDEMLIDLPLIADWPRRPMQKVDHEFGKPSQTRVRVLERNVADDCSRLLLEPITGRSHQLRVHLQAVGHPILGDGLYADEADRQRAPRLLLHACELQLPALGPEPARTLLCPAPF